MTVDNGVVRAVFSNRGATLAAWELLRYLGPDGKPVDLVPHDVPANQPKPFSLRLDDAAKTARLNTRAVYTSSGAAPPTRCNAWTREPRPVTIAFEYQDAAGLHARKQFTLKPNSYEVTVSVECHRRRRRAESIRAVGTWAGRRACDRRRQHVHAAPQVGSDLLDRRRRGTHSGRRSGDDAAVSGQLRVCRRRHALFHVRGGEAGHRRARVLSAVGSVEDRGRGGVARLRRLRHPLAVDAERARRTRVSSSGRSTSKR